MLLQRAVEGARDAGASVNQIVLRDQKISPCLEIYGCRRNGECAIRDDFQKVRDDILSAGGVMLASPIFFLHGQRPYQDSDGPVSVSMGQKVLD